MSWAGLFHPVVIATSLPAAVYLGGVRRARRLHPDPNETHRASLCFLGGLGVLLVTLRGPLESKADLRFSIHMVQHLLLTMVAAPLLLLGEPVTLALRASSRGVRRRILVPLLRSRAVRILTHPLVGWLSFFAVMWGSHYSRLYEAALQSERVHVLEHLTLLASALLFWWPVVGRGPSAARISHPARILYLFLAMPQMAFLGLGIYSANHVLYQHYATVAPSLGISALSDQHLAGAIMWEVGMFLMVVALALVMLDWMRRDEREATRVDTRRARASATAQ